MYHRTHPLPAARGAFQLSVTVGVGVEAAGPGIRMQISAAHISYLNLRCGHSNVHTLAGAASITARGRHITPEHPGYGPRSAVVPFTNDRHTCSVPRVWTVLKTPMRSALPLSVWHDPFLTCRLQWVPHSDLAACRDIPGRKQAGQPATSLQDATQFVECLARF